MATTVGTLYAEIRATTAGLRRDMADAVQITRQSTQQMSQVLDEFGKPAFTGLTEGARRVKAPIADVDSSLRGLARTTRGLVAPLASELAPAFDTVGIRIAQVLTTSASLGSGLGALAIAAAGLAGVVGGQLLTAWTKNAEEMAKFQTAINSLETGKIQEEIDKTIKKLDELAATRRKVLGPEGLPREIPETTVFGHARPSGRGAPAGLDAERDRLLRNLEALNKARELAKEGLGAELVGIDVQMNAKLVADAKASDDLLKQQQEARFAAARAIGAAVNAEVELTTKEAERAAQTQFTEVEKLEQARVRLAHDAGRAVNEEVEATNRQSVLFDLERLNEEDRLRQEGVRSEIEAAQDTIDTHLKMTQDLVQIGQARARDAQRVRDEFVDSFQPINFAIQDALISITQQTTTVAQAFETMGRSIAASLLDNVINKGLKAVENALFDFLQEMQKSGLTGALIKTLAGLGVGAAGIGVGATASAGGFGAGDTGAQIELQHGGIVMHGTRALIGEGGPEAVIPLSQLGSAGTEIVIHNYSGADVQHSERAGSDGRRLHEFIISAVRQGAASGELESMFSGFGGRRVAMQR